MRVLLVHRYFWPDTPPYASMLRSIAEHLVQEGHEVQVISAQPSYGGSARHDSAQKRETVDGIDVTRVTLLDESPEQTLRRSINLGLFAIRVLTHVLRRRNYDVIMAATTPPVLIGLTAHLAARATGARSIYHMQDIYPEVLAANSGRTLSISLRLVRLVDSYTTLRADRVVVLSEDMKTTLGRRHRPVDHIRTINNFLPDRDHVERSDELAGTWGKAAAKQVVFAGNLGSFQGLDSVVDAFHILDARGVSAELILLGDGVARSSLVERSGKLSDRTIHFPGRVSQTAAEQIVAASDLALVTLNRGVISTAFPSKTMTYLSCGTPVLAAVEEDSELARTLKLNDVGRSCSLEPAKLADAIEAMLDQPPDRSVVESFAEKYASRAARLPDWVRLLEDLDGQTP